MTLNEILARLPYLLRIKKSKNNSSSISNWSILFNFLLIFITFLIFLITSNLINKNKKINNQNFSELVKSEEFINIGSYLISKINSPYEEITYLIQNNDNIEKILKKFQINVNDIKIISNNLKQKKLTNIYAGRELSLILRKIRRWIKYCDKSCISNKRYF